MRGWDPPPATKRKTLMGNCGWGGGGGGVEKVVFCIIRTNFA